MFSEERFKAGAVAHEKYYTVVMREPSQACCAMPMCVYCADAPNRPCFCKLPSLTLSPVHTVSLMQRVMFCAVTSGRVCHICWKPRSSRCEFDGLWRCQTTDIPRKDYPRCDGVCVCRPSPSPWAAGTLDTPASADLGFRCTYCFHHHAKPCPRCRLSVCGPCVIVGGLSASTDEWTYHTCRKDCGLMAAFKFLGVDPVTPMDMSDQVAATRENQLQSLQDHRRCASCGDRPVRPTGDNAGLDLSTPSCLNCGKWRAYYQRTLI